MLKNDTVIVTGSSRGLGRHIAVKLADVGANVVLADLHRENPDGGPPTDELVAERGADGTFVETDVSDPASVEALMDRVTTEYETLDALVNNAGLHSMGRVDEISVEEWQQVIDVNLTGTFLCCKFALPDLLDGGGDIVNVSSIAGLKGSANAPAYCASKAGVANFTRQLVVDYGGEGLRANSIHPGPINTDSLDNFGETEKGSEILADIPSGELGEPEEVAACVAFLLSDDAGYVNGHQFVVDGGISARYY